MKHASHKATTVSRQKFSLAKALFASGKGSHSVRAVRAVQSAGSDAVVLGLDPAIAEKINEIAPQTRRSIREAARAAERRSHILASASLAALVGTAAGKNKDGKLVLVTAINPTPAGEGKTTTSAGLLKRCPRCWDTQT